MRDSGLLSVEELQDAPLVVEGYHDDATRHDGHGGIERKARRNGGPAAAEGGTGDIDHATAVLILDGDGRIAWRVDGGSGGVAELLAGAR